MRRVAFLCVMLTLAAAVRAQSPSVTYLRPSAVLPGGTTELTIHGGNLAGADALWATFPAQATFPDKPQAADHVTCRVTLPADAQVGIHAVRVATPAGVSDLRLLMVDDLPTVAEASSNTTAAAAQPLAPPVAVDGACEAGEADYYRFAAKKGQRVAVEVVAARLGSQLDPFVRLLDAAGRELAWCDDAAGAGGDARFAHTFAADGEYVIEVRDTAYGGGADFRYRLRVGDFPLATVPVPLAGRRGGAAMFAFAGPDCGDVVPVAVKLPADAGAVALGVKWAAARGAAGGSGFASALLGDFDESVEAEPNDAPSAASPLAVPSAASGRLDKPGDRDFYQLAAGKGQRLVFRARSRSLGAPCDVLLRLYRPGGAKLAESKVEGAAEAALDATAPEAGVYWLCVEDLAGGGGPGLAYRVEAEPYRPGFSLSVETDKVEAKPGETFQLKVTCARRDYGGPVELSVAGVEGLKLEAATIPAGKNETTLKVTLPPDFKPAGIPHVRVAGTAKVGDAEFATTASTMPALRKQFPRLLYPPELTDGLIAVGVRRP